jgi:predicted transcriptional regulator
VLEALADDDCRLILAALSEQQRSAPELAEACEIARSTMYRKLDRLRSAGLVEKRLRVTERGPTANEYTIGETCLRIRCSSDVADGLSLSIADSSD